MGFLTRLLAGLTAAAALGAGLSGTAGTTTNASGGAEGVVAATADDTSNLPDHLVNGDFEYLPDGGWKTIDAPYDMDSAYTSVDPVNGQYIRNTRHVESDPASEWVDWKGFDASRFAWRSDQKGGQNQGGVKDHANSVELQQDSMDGNTYAEIVASETDRTIYQDIRTTPGTLYKIQLKHASLCRDNVDRMQVVVNGTPVEMTRTAANGKDGDKVGEKSTTIATRVTNVNRFHHADQWETYVGYYVVPEGQTVTRFGFKAVNYLDPTKGNLLDDVSFARSYRLSYDKNASDATGQVPSDEYGKENTVKQAKTQANGKSKTSGTVEAIDDENQTADQKDDTDTDTDMDTDSATDTEADTNRQEAETQSSTAQGKAADTTSLPDHIVNGSFDYPSVPSWTGLPGSGSNKYNKGKLFATINPGTGKYGSGCAMSTTGKAIPNWNRSSFAWSSTQGDTHHSGGMSCEAGNVELNYDSVHHNQFAELTADQQGTAIYQDVKVTPGTMMKWSLKHSSATSAYVDKMQVMIGEPYKETAQEATRITSENGNKVGEKMTTISTPTTSDRADNKKWDTYSGAYLVPDGVTTVRFTFKSVASAEWYSGNDLDDIEFSRSYKLTYDKNSSDAAGEVPSNQRGKENTVQPAASKTNGTVKTVADESVRYGSLFNGDFSYPSFSDIQKNEQEGYADLRTFLKSDDGTLWYNMSDTDLSKYGKIGRIPGFDSSRFAWSSTENGSRVELQQDRNTKNTYAEIVAQQDNTSIYQNVSTGNGGVLYKIRLKHASRQSSHADRMQVLVGSDTDHATPVEMTRVTSNGHGDKTGEKSTTIATKVSNTDKRDHGSQWETYEGFYQVPDGQKNTIFMFKSLEGFKETSDLSGNNVGNLVDDIEFSRSYKLTYDKNAQDAAGQVPSDTTANTVKQVRSKASGTVRLVSDDDVAEYAANGLPKQIVNSDFDHDWQNIVSQSRMSEKYNFANIDPKHGDVEISGGLNGKGEASKQWVHLNGFDASKFGWKSNQTDTRVDGRGGIVEIQRSRANDNMYAEITASQAGTYLYQDIDTAHDYPTVYTVKLRYAHRNGTVNSNEKIQILVGAPGHERPVEMTRIASDRGNRLGEKSTTVNAPNTDGWLGSWDTFQGSVVVPAGQNVSRFTFQALGSIDGVSGNLIDDVQFDLAYKLSYDKNANDASGQIPSDETANTVKQAKAKSSGGVRLAADRTDGRVSDLVQRTTTHADGSVTVRTVDTTTDVVSGCQVYYPAGQKITLATLAKDDDCWDSSMLSRPGHTQLGWNQDRNATQAQAQVTMVEGGMTVYAVWVGNPVLTYDTNKPSTWSGQMPSTPASISVAYNTAATDGSGWRAGDTTKIRGYKFLGWYSTPQDGSGLYDWTRPLTGNVTVYAHWQRLQANVIYDKNASDAAGSHANTTGWQYSDVTIPGDTSKSFTRDGYVFKGWSLKAGKADVVYKDGSQIPLQDKDITLYAQWQGIHENFTETGGISLPLLIAGGIGLLVMGVGSTVMLTRRMNGHGMPDGE